jgi:hypothetical protein
MITRESPDIAFQLAARASGQDLMFYSPKIAVDLFSARRYCSLMKAEVSRLSILRRIFTKVRELLDRPTDVRYTSVPIWRPWRKF